MGYSLNDLQLYELDTSRPLDELIDNSYQASSMLYDMAACLSDPHCRRWSPGLSKKLQIPFAECRLTAGRIYFRDRLVVAPDDPDIQLQVLYRTHASGPGGHPGRVKTIDLLNRSYWWPGMTVATRSFCNACMICDKTKK